jgi:hypothetical protein
LIISELEEMMMHDDDEKITNENIKSIDKSLNSIEMNLNRIKNLNKMMDGFYSVNAQLNEILTICKERRATKRWKFW